MSDPQIQITLNGGPNEGVDPRQLPPGSVISVSNATYDAEGTYQPRFGYTALSAGTGPAGIVRLSTYQSQLLADDGATLWSWDAQASAWGSRDTIPPYQVSHAPLQNASTTFTSWDEVIYQGYRVVVWVDGLDSLLRYAVYSTATGACISGPNTVSTAVTYSFVQIGLLGTTAIFIGNNASASRIDAYALPLAPIGAVSGARVDAGDAVGGGTAKWAVTFTGGAGGTFILAYEHSVSGTQSSIRLRSFNSSLTLQQDQQFTYNNGTFGFLTISANVTPAENLWVSVYAQTSAYATNMLLIRCDPTTLVQSAGPLTQAIAGQISHALTTGNVSSALVRISSTVVRSFFVFSGSLTNASVTNLTVAATQWQDFNTTTGIGISWGVTNAALVTQPVFDLRGGAPIGLFLVPSSTPTLTGKVMSGGASTSTSRVAPINGTYVLGQPNSVASLAAQTQGCDHLATIAPQLAAGIPTLLPHLVQNGSAFETVAPVTHAQGRLGLESIQLSRGPALHIGATVGRTFFVGGCMFDGQRIVENGFTNPPPPALVVDNSGAPTNSYQYVQTYARVDNMGNLEESAPSLAQSITSSSPPNVTLTCTPLHLTRKQREPVDSQAPAPVSKAYVLIYRTQALEAGDSTLHLVTAIPFPLANANTLLADQITITDTTSDATIAAQASIYTNSGELQHDAPEQIHGVITHFNRPVGIGADNRTIWVGQAYVDGVVPQWSLLVQLTLDDGGEPLTAVASLYDKLLVFTRRRVYVLYGDGPSIANTGAEWTLPLQRVPGVSGCIDARSVVYTSKGIFFQSERGLELVRPDLQTTFVGLPISQTTASFPICASATNVTVSSTVRFCMTTSDTFASQAGGRLVLYDLRYDRWTAHSLTAGGAAGSNVGAPCYASTYHTTLGYVEGHNLDQYGNTANAVISRENTASDATPWADYGTTFVPLSVVLAWIKSGDLQGWQRVRRLRALADFHDAHGLTITLDYDYQTIGESHALTSAQVAALLVGGREQVRIIPGRGKSQAIRATLATTAPTSPQVLGSGRGAGLIGVAFEILPQKGGYRNIGSAAKG